MPTPLAWRIKKPCVTTCVSASHQRSHDNFLISSSFTPSSMRLTTEQIQIIKETIARFMGENARVWLFGSRVDDHRRGGDYDFYLETTLTNPADIIQRKLAMLSELHATPGFEDEKIDLVIRPHNVERELPIYQIAKSEGQEL